MRVGSFVLKVGFRLRRDKYRGDTSASEFGESAAGVVALSFVPGEDDEEGFTRRFQRWIEFIHLFLEPAISEVKSAVMGGITNIGGNKYKVGQVVQGDVPVQLGERNDTALAAFRIQTDWVKIDEGIVFLHVTQSTASEAGFGHIVLIGFPGAPALLDEVGQAGGIDKTVFAIAGDPEGVAADQ